MENTVGSNVMGISCDPSDSEWKFSAAAANLENRCNCTPLPVGLELKESTEKILLRMEMEKNARDTFKRFAGKPESRRAEHFPISFIQIGEYKVRAIHEAHLVAKCFYGKKKLVWEILDGSLKNKIEISWQYICGMRVTLPENSPGILEFELNQPPVFFHEENPRPGKRTVWKLSSDFTGREATKHRIHLVQFSVGVLNKYYEKLVECDDQFWKLSQLPFPTSESPYFYPNSYQRLTGCAYGHDDRHTYFSSQPFQNFGIAMPPQVSLSPEQFHNAMRNQGIIGPISSPPGIYSCLNEGVNNLVLVSSQPDQQFGNAVGDICSYPISSAFDSVLPTHQGINGQALSASDEVINYQTPEPLQFRCQIPARLGIDDSISLPSGLAHLVSPPQDQQSGNPIPECWAINNPVSSDTGILSSPDAKINNQMAIGDPERAFSNGGDDVCVNLLAMDSKANADNGEHMNMAMVQSSMEEDPACNTHIDPQFELWNIENFDPNTLDVEDYPPTIIP